MMTGNDLRTLRRGLVLTEASFAKYLGIKPSLLKQAEKFKKKEILLDNEKFKPLYAALVRVAPHMVVARLQQMQNVAQVLKDISEKLKRSAKWLKRDDQKTSEQTKKESVVVDEKTPSEKEEPKKDRRSAAEM